MAKRKRRIAVPVPGKTETREAIDAFMKNLIDDLIVPKLVEEFLQLYGPAAAAKQEPFVQINQHPHPDSELNSTP
jgi:hypothetical protein